MYKTQIRRILISFLNFASIAIWFLYLYFKLWSFVKAAIYLKYINIQTVTFTLYSFLLVLLPSAIVFTPKFSKKKLFMWICFLISASLFIGAIGDLFTYVLFKNYKFSLGDAIFCNIVVSIPNSYGTFCCLALALAYALLGIYMTKSRFITCSLYFIIFLIGTVPPFLYSFNTWGTFPMQSWVQKAAFIIPHQACLLLSFILSGTSKYLWKERLK